MIVLDASALLELLRVTDEGRDIAERIAEETLHAPHLIDLEVAQVLRRYVARRQLDEVRASQALEDLRDLDLDRATRTTCCWAGSGSYSTTPRPTTLRISPWRRCSGRPCLPPTLACARRRMCGHTSRCLTLEA